MRALALILILLLAGCVSPGGGSVIVPTGITQATEVNGTGTIGSVLIGGFPWTYPIRFTGDGTLRLQYPATPHVWLDGDFTWEVVIPEQAPMVEAEMRAGRFKVGD
jgi:hypothetical protein